MKTEHLLLVLDLLAHVFVALSSTHARAVHIVLQRSSTTIAITFVARRAEALRNKRAERAQQDVVQLHHALEGGKTRREDVAWPRYKREGERTRW